MAFQIKFHQIRAFVEVAREGSIRGASRALAVSQPALTKAIKELEEDGCRRNLANAVPTRWSTKPATCACTPMST